MRLRFTGSTPYPFAAAAAAAEVDGFDENANDFAETETETTADAILFTRFSEFFAKFSSRFFTISTFSSFCRYDDNA